MHPAEFALKGNEPKKNHFRVQELRESRGGRRGLPVLMSLIVSVDVKQHWTMHTRWSHFAPNMSTQHPRTLSSTSSSSHESDCEWRHSQTAAYLPALVMIISVPSCLKACHRAPSSSRSVTGPSHFSTQIASLVSATAGVVSFPCSSVMSANGLNP